MAANEVRAGKAYVEVGVRDKLDAGLRRAQARLNAFAAGAQQLGASMLRAGTVLAAPLVLAVKVFADFERQMANVSTMLDRPAESMGRFRDELRKMAVEFGEGTDALAGGLYDILSASVAPEKALGVLRVAVRAAKAGLSDTKTAADAITTVLNAYGLSAERAGEVSDILFQTVRRGKTTFGELAPQIGQVASVAASAGVSFAQLSAFLALLTRNGVKTENAVTAVKQVVLSFLKPADEAAAYARQLGFAMDSATLKSQGLAAVFQRIAGLPPDAIARLFPNARAITGVIPALRSISELAEDVGAMEQSAGATEAAWSKMSRTAAQSFAELRRAAEDALIGIGEALAPMVQLLGGLVRGVAAAAAGLGPLAKLLAGVAGSLLLLGGAAWAIGKLAAVAALGVGAFRALAASVALLKTAVFAAQYGMSAWAILLRGVTAATWGWVAANTALIGTIGLVAAPLAILAAGFGYAANAAHQAAKRARELTSETLRFGSTAGKLFAAIEAVKAARTAGDAAAEVASLKDLIALRERWIDALKREADASGDDDEAARLRAKAAQWERLLAADRQRLALVEDRAAAEDKSAARAEANDEGRVRLARELARVRAQGMEDEFARGVELLRIKYTAQLDAARKAGEDQLGIEELYAEEVLQLKLANAKTLAAEQQRLDDERAARLEQQLQEEFDARMAEAEKLVDAEERLDEELARQRIENTLKGAAKDKALNDLERDRRLREAREIGLDPGRINELYDLREAGLARAGDVVRGTFNPAAILALQGAGGSAAERTAKGVEEMRKDTRRLADAADRARLVFR